MSQNLKNGQQLSSNRINNHTITRIVKSQSADDNSPKNLVIFSECSIEESNVPVKAMTAMTFQDDSTTYTSPSAFSSNVPVSADDRQIIELALAESVTALMKQLKENAQLDPKKFEVVSDDQFAEMFSEC
jgi:hypothetical protein